MKKITAFLVMLLVGLTSYSQIANYNEVITKAKRGKITTYFSKNNQKFSIHDTLVLGYPFRNDEYDFIKELIGINIYPLESNAADSKVTIKRMKIYSKHVLVYTTKPNGYDFGLYISSLEGGLKSGEIVDDSFMTSEEALKKLKTEKDKLDLGLITQEEYDKKKAELSKFIK